MNKESHIKTFVLVLQSIEEASSDEESSEDEEIKKKQQKKRRRPHVEIEYEQELDQPSASKAKH